jgi:methionyl-tRNA formyltransferase
MSHLKIIFAGSGAFGLPALRAIRSAGHDIVQVFSQPDRPAGRGRKLTPTPIAEYSIEQSLPLTRTANINHEPLPQVDLLVVIAFGQKIAEHVAHQARLGSVNLHASLLPKYRGAAPINAAILTGERITGNSVIRLAQRMDAGAVLAQSTVEIGELETAGELHDRLAADGAPLLLSVLQSLADGTVEPVVQDDALATLAPKMSRETARIDWSTSAVRIARQIRGLFPSPGCRVQLMRGQDITDRVTLVRARAIVSPAGEAGIIQAGGTVAAAEGAIEILEVQPEGKRPMPLGAYRNGHPWEAGMRLEPT